MEFVTGIKEKETLELSELLAEGMAGNTVKVNGFIHTIRDMGNVAFMILRKRDGLIQCVFEEGITNFSLKDLREADTVEVTGILINSEKAPGGIEIRISAVRILSEPAEPLPPISREEQEFEQLQTFYMFRLRDSLVNISKGKMPSDLPALAKDVVQHFGTLDHKVHFTQTIRSNSDFVYKHSVGVSIISAMIGHAMGLRESTLQSLITAAFLYDFGYLYVPADIMKKGEDITEIESSAITKYREKAFALLHADTNPYNIPPDALAIVTQMIKAGRAEGEQVDRSKWLTGTSILTVADKFDRMTAMSLSRKPNSEISAIRYLIDHPDSYPKNVVSALAQCIHIMPVGCCVDLTNGDKGLVLEANEGDFNHPVVLSFTYNTILDLKDPKNKGIKIADVMHTMDNRVKMDDETLKQFQSDENSSKMIKKFEFKKLELKKRGRA